MNVVPGGANGQLEQQEKDPGAGEAWEVMRESIRDRYNSRTELIMDVKADGDKRSSKPQ